VNRRESQSSSFSNFFRSKEGLEQTRLGVETHAQSRIADGDHCKTPRDSRPMVLGVFSIQLDDCRFESELASRRHCISGVDSQVHDDLLELTRVNYHWAGILGKLAYELDVFADDSAQHFVSAAQNVIEVNEPRLDKLLACGSPAVSGQV